MTKLELTCVRNEKISLTQKDKAWGNGYHLDKMSQQGKLQKLSSWNHRDSNIQHHMELKSIIHHEGKD